MSIVASLKTPTKNWLKPLAIGLSVFWVFGLLSCSNTTNKDKTLISETELEKVRVEQQAQKQNALPPAQVTQSLLQNPTVNSAASSKATAVERFDVSVRNMPARDFFLGLVNGTGVNVVVHPQVSGTVTLNLKNVSVENVLSVTRDIYGYEFKYDHGIYTIYANEMRTQVFQLNYLDVQRVGVSDTSVLVGRAQNSGGNGNSKNSSASSGNDSANLLGMIDNGKQSKSGGLTPGSRVQTLNHTDFWASLENTLSAIIGGEADGRSVMVSPQAGMIVVKARPQELNAVRDYLERSELSAKRQVILEAKILEVRLSEGFEAGVNWNSISGQLGYGYSSGRGDISASDNLNLTLDANLQPTGGTRNISESSVYGGKGLFSSLIQVADISTVLSLLETQGTVQVLSSPRVSTVNNQKAVIRVGSDEYFITGISNNTTTNASATTSTPNIELSPFFSGISLDVTPQISETGEVILHIHPIVSEVTDQLKVFTVGSENFSLPLALRGIRESDSIVKAKNGQVIVLGGLMTESGAVEDGKRPVLGDIPLVNSLFRTKKKKSSKTELVILLRPIVVGDSTWDNEIEQAEDAAKRLGDTYRNN